MMRYVMTIAGLVATVTPALSQLPAQRNAGDARLG